MTWFRWLRTFRAAEVPQRLSEVKVAFAWDGGTMAISGQDGRGRKREVVLTSSLPHRAWFGPRPGRLYLDGRLVPLRGDAERAILRLLELVVEDLRRERAASEANTQILQGMIGSVRSPGFGGPRVKRA